MVTYRISNGYPIADSGLSSTKCPGRGLEQSPRLRIAKRRCAALIVIGGRALYAVHRVADDHVPLTQIIEQRGKRRKLTANARRREVAGFHVLAPGDDMRPPHRAQRKVIFQIGEGDELRDIDFIGASRFFIGDVREPFQLGRYIREIVVLIPA